MPNATLDEFRAYFGDEFPADTYSDTAVNRALDEAADIYNLTRRGQLYLTAHFLVVNREAEQIVTDGAGVVTGESIGTRRLDYTVPSANPREVGYARTDYGLRFLELRRAATVGPWSFE